jgi:catechol 2,3-dioxygenase
MRLYEVVSDQLAADTAMGAVTLLVADLDAMTAYYRDAVTLQVLSEGNGTVTLGRGATPVIILESAPALKHASPRDAGLFHTAILFDTERALAAAVYSVARRHPGSFTGSSDHLVSKAFYFDDPEGNGVELYWDRARSEWSWTHGQVEMSTLFLDPNLFLQQNLTDEVIENPVDGGAVVGHVHHRDPRPGRLRERWQVPPPHGHECLEQPGCRPTRSHPRARPC